MSRNGFQEFIGPLPPYGVGDVQMEGIAFAFVLLDFAARGEFQVQGIERLMMGALWKKVEHLCYLPLRLAPCSRIRHASASEML